jgi:hypothetical protein
LVLKEQNSDHTFPDIAALGFVVRSSCMTDRGTEKIVWGQASNPDHLGYVLHRLGTAVTEINVNLIMNINMNFVGTTYRI